MFTNTRMITMLHKRLNDDWLPLWTDQK